MTGKQTLKLRRERAAFVDDELGLRSGPNGVTAVLLRPRETVEPPDELLAERVALHPFLAGMKHHDLALLADCAQARRFEKGEVILEQGGAADRFYLIESGKVVLESVDIDHCRVVIDRVRAGDLLGCSWMFPPFVWHFTARAAEPVEAIAFSGKVLREYCARDHSLGYELFQRMSAVMLKRLQAAREKVLAGSAR